MKLKKMQKILRNVDKGVKVQGKKKKVSLSEVPEKWGERTVKEAYQDKDGLTLVLGGKGKKKVDNNEPNDIDESIDKLKRDLHITDDEESSGHDKKSEHKHDHKDHNNDRRDDRNRNRNNRFNDRNDRNSANQQNNENKKHDPFSKFPKDDEVHKKLQQRKYTEEDQLDNSGFVKKEDSAEQRALEKAGISTTESAPAESTTENAPTNDNPHKGRPKKKPQNNKED